MPYIVQQTFSDGVTQGLRLGVTPESASGESGFYRKLSFGNNWSWIRMGILCAIDEVPSSSFPRAFGVEFGAMTGSRTGNTYPSRSMTGIGLGLGKMTSVWGFDNTEGRFQYANHPISGSFFWSDSIAGGSMNSGSLGVDTAGAGVTSPTIASLREYNKRRSIIIYEISQSSVSSYYQYIYGFSSASIVSKNANIDFTSTDLIGAMTSSLTTTLTTRGRTLDVITDGLSPHVHATKSMDTVYVDYCGGTPLEIYDWYIYKIA